MLGLPEVGDSARGADAGTSHNHNVLEIFPRDLTGNVLH